MQPVDLSSEVIQCAIDGRPQGHTGPKSHKNYHAASLPQASFSNYGAPVVHIAAPSVSISGCSFTNTSGGKTILPGGCRLCTAEATYLQGRSGRAC